MKTLSTFMSRILPHVPACPDVVAQEALVDTAIELCEKSLIVRQTLDPIDTESGTLEYELFAPSNQSVVVPLQVWFKTQLLEAVAADRVRNVQAYSVDVVGYTSITGGPLQYFWTAPSTIGLYPLPQDTEQGSIVVRAALKPTRSATQLEDVLYDDWLDVLVAGTLARLHAMKDQPWASADRALLHAREFRSGVQRARVEGSLGRVRTSMGVRMRGF